jgi:hypothetical protein
MSCSWFLFSRQRRLRVHGAWISPFPLRGDHSMARFSSLRRSAQLLFLTAGLSSVSAAAESYVQTSGFVPCSTSQETAQLVAKTGVVGAYNHGFKTLVREGEAGKHELYRLLVGSWPSTVKMSCVSLSQACCTAANEADLDALSLKFLAAEQIEASAQAHCREFAVSAELCGSIVMSAKTPAPRVQRQLGADSLERLGIDFQIVPRIIISEEEENLLGVVPNDTPPAPRTLAAAFKAQGTGNASKLNCVQIAPADFVQVSAYRAVSSSYEALLAMPFSMDKLLTLQVEVSPLQEVGVTGCFGPVPLEQPTLRMSSLTQERMLRHFANSTTDDSPVVNDAAPTENPAAELVAETGIEPQPEEFVQQLPPSSDVPLLNPPAVAAISPTMSPLEYAELFLTQAERQDHQVQLAAHEAPVEACVSPLLRALGGPISVTPCESETCKGWTIQFGSCEQPAAEAAAFDGPAQITLHDGPCKCGSSLAKPAKPAASEETLDELADRLERDFLRRAVAGQIQLPATCQGGCPSANCCPPGPDAERGTPGIALPDPVCAVKIPSPRDSQNSCQAGAGGGAEALGCPMLGSNPGVCGNIVLDPVFQVSMPAPTCCGNNGSAGVGLAECKCPACPKACGGECCCAKKDGVPVPAVTWNPYVNEPVASAGGVPAPQLAMVPHGPMAYPPFARAPKLAPAPAPMMAARMAMNPELLDAYREISRTLDQLAERCEANAMYEKADELRDLAREYRMDARMIHGHLSALAPLPGPMLGAQPVAWFPTPPMMPYPMPVPGAYAPEPMPTFGPPAAPTTPVTMPQPLPIAQPMMVPRY